MPGIPGAIITGEYWMIRQVQRMDERNLSRLEFDKIKQELARYAVSEPGREIIANLVPLKNQAEITDRLAETTEGTELLRLEPTAPLGGWHDIRREVKHSQREGVMEAPELWRVLQTLVAARQTKGFFSQRKDVYRLLDEIASGLGDFRILEKALAGAILPGGEISDRATERLSSIRRKLVSAQERVKERLNNIIRSVRYQKYLQDPIVTMREGRYVVPVKQEYRSQIPGIVHDQSTSGATLFIEPMPVVEANNEVRSLLAAEKQEVAKILRDLSAQVGAVGEELLSTLDILGVLDFIMAKAHYSKELDAMAPRIVPEPRLDIRNARHPLLSGSAVPISIHLGGEFDVLVITGPNTGGKTVTLKTVGLIVAMAHSGLHVPVGQQTDIGMFSDVFVDIGDEQSIEQSLSTFSSHMSNIVGILGRVGARSLVLLDELGAGTDPTEGSALAQAILDQLRQLGAKTVATTHYGELKNYAYANDGVENASVDFDPETLRPTYKLIIGRPGRSNAFEIAGRLGLDESVLQKARGYLTEEQIQQADLMQQLEMARVQAERDRAQAGELRRQAEEHKVQYESQLRSIQARKDDSMARAVTEAREIVKRARHEADYLLEQLRNRLKETSVRPGDLSTTRIRRQLEQLQNDLEGKMPEPDLVSQQGLEPVTNVKPGDKVFIPKFGQTGVVLEASEKDDTVQVQVGVIRINVSPGELTRVRDEQGEKQDNRLGTGLGTLVQQKARDISSQLDLRGMRVETALEMVEKYLDDASLAGLVSVYLVHGKGTGALRSAIQQMLKEHPLVKEFRLGKYGEGDTGVTVVKFV